MLGGKVEQAAPWGFFLFLICQKKEKHTHALILIDNASLYNEWQCTMYAVIKSQGEISFVIVHQMSLLTTVKLIVITNS